MKDYLFNRPLLTALILLALSVVILLLAADWYERKQVKKSHPTFSEMSQEIEELETSLGEMISHVRNKEMALDMREELLEEKNIELAFMSDKLRKMEKQHAATKEKTEKLQEQLAASKAMLKEAYALVDAERNSQGLVYRVQIGMLKDEVIPSFPFQADMFLVEEAAEHNKYVLGSFREYDASLEFRDLIRKLGMKDAWVVAYVDGNRMELTEAQAHAHGDAWGQEISMEDS